MNLGHGRNVDADVFIHFYMLACLNNISKTFYVFYSYIIAVMFLLFHSGYSVFILCTHWPIAMFDVYDFNLCVFYHVLGQRWPNKRVQSITFEQRNSTRNGSDRASYQESTSCHIQKKFFCSLNFFCEKFPIKHCSTHNMWIRWSFRSISSSYFHRNIMYIWIFAHPRLTTYQLDWTRMLYKRK